MRVGINQLFSTDEVISFIKNHLDTLDIPYILEVRDVSLSDLLDSSDLDVIVCPHHLLPFERRPNKVWALLSRIDASDTLIVRKDILDPSNRLKVPDDATVLVPSYFVKSKLDEVSNGIKMEVKNNREEILTYAQEGKLSAGILESCFIDDVMKEKYLAIPLNVKEFGHQAGQGAFAVVSSSDSEYGTVLRRLYHTDTVRCANEERKCNLLMNGNVAVHIERDSTGNYLAWASRQGDNDYTSINLSYSTRKELAEKIVSRLN